MKVLLLSGEFPPMQGGVGDYTTCLAAALERLGVSCVVVTSAGRGVPAAANVCPRMPAWRLRDWPLLLRLIRSHRPDVLHIQYQTAAFGMRPLINLVPLLVRAARLPIPVVTTFHDLRVPYLFPKAGPMRHLVNRILAGGSDACVVTNDEDMETLASVLRPTRGRPHATLIPIGSNIAVDPAGSHNRADVRARFETPEGVPLISFFGLINQSKGVETLFAAIAGLPAHHQARVLMIGGTEGDSDSTNVPYRRRVIDLCHELGLDARIIWTGYSSSREVSALLSAADVCVLPFRDGASFRRGSLLAALTHSLPVVTTLPPSGNCPGAGTAKLRDADNCLLVRPDDPSAIRAALARVLASPPLREQLARGAAALSKQFAWDRIAADTVALYADLRGVRGR